MVKAPYFPRVKTRHFEHSTTEVQDIAMSLIGADDLEMDAALMDAGASPGADFSWDKSPGNKKVEPWELVGVGDGFRFLQKKLWWNSGTGIGHFMIFHGEIDVSCEHHGILMEFLRILSCVWWGYNAI